MGKIPVKCTACQATFDALLSFAGQIRPCPHCKTPLQIPFPATSPAAKSTDHSGIQVSPVPLISEPPSADAERLVTLSTFFRPLVAILSIVCVSLLLVLVFVPAPQREQLAQGEQLAQEKTTPAEQPPVAIEPPAPQPPVVDKQPAAEVAPPPEKIKQPAEEDPIEKDLLALPTKQGKEQPLVEDPPEAKPDPVLLGVINLEKEAAPANLKIAPGDRAAKLNPPKFFGTQVIAKPLPGEEQDYLLTRQVSFTPYQRKLSFPLAQFDIPRDRDESAKNFQSMPMWTLQLQTAKQAIELAMRTNDLDQLASDLAMLRTIRVHLGLTLAIQLREHGFANPNGPGFKYKKARDDLLVAWKAYLQSWQKLAQNFELQIRAAVVTPLHNPEDLVFMDILLNPPPPPANLNVGTWARQFRILPQFINTRFPDVKNIQAFYQAERQARRLSSPELICNLADLHWLTDPKGFGLANLRYHQRHGRIVTGLRVGIIVHHEDRATTLRDYYSSAEFEIKNRQRNDKYLKTQSTHTHRQMSEIVVGVPYQHLVAELHKRMVLGQFGPAYADLHPWDQQNIGQMGIFAINLSDALNEAWLASWDYAIIIKKSNATPDLEIKLVDLISLEELEKFVMHKPPMDIETLPKDYRKNIVSLLQSVDHYVTLQPLPPSQNSELAKRLKFQKDSFLRESFTSIILEKTYRQQFLNQTFPLASDADNSLRQGQYDFYFKPITPMDVPTRTCYLTMSLLGPAYFQSSHDEKPYLFYYSQD